MTKLAIMRMKDKMTESIDQAKGLGFDPMFASPLELSEMDTPEFWKFVDELEADKVGRVLLTSATAIRFMFDLLEKNGKASSAFSKLNKRGIIAIGPLTAEAAKLKWLKADTVPERFTSERLASLLKGKVAKDDTVWIVRSDQGSEVLRKGLESLGAMVKEVSVYTLKKSDQDRALLDMYYFTVNGGIDAYLFTSPLSAKAFIEEGEKKYGVREFGTALNDSIIAAMGEPTKNMLESMGVDADVTSMSPKFEDVLRTIKNYIEKSTGH